MTVSVPEAFFSAVLIALELFEVTVTVPPLVTVLVVVHVPTVDEP